ncbi:MAG: HAD-IIIA family hydrolase [Nitrospirota bacterium]
MTRPAVFLDRDGTINEEIGFLFDPDAVSLIPGAAEALIRLREAGFALVVVTNQSGIARGLFTEAELMKVNSTLERLLAEKGAGIDRFYHCPHHPKYGEMIDCGCRKPKPGMALAAAAELGLDIGKSYFVGDKLSDIELGKNAGGKTVLVLTGFGIEEKRLLEARGLEPDMVKDALPEAADWIIKDRESSL